MSALGALIGLILSIILITRKVAPVYSLIIGAIVGGLLGGLKLIETVDAMISGAKDMVPAMLRILMAGILSGVLIKTGAAASISHTIIHKLGKKHIYLALALSTMLLTAVGVFIDVAVITVAPIALMAGHKLSIPKLKLLLVMIGGGKCGNIISPNPNTIVAAENFNAPLPSVMFVNLIPAIIGLLVVVYVIARMMPSKGEPVADMGSENETAQKDLPTFWASIVAPVVAIILLALRPLFGIIIDPLIALPLGGISGVLVMRKWKDFVPGTIYGLEKMSMIVILFVGTGAIAGIIKVSTMKDVLIAGLEWLRLGETFIAPVAAALMSAATASTTAGATIASASFSDVILAAGISATWGAAMVNSGATILDHLPHGSFFHATGGSVEMQMKERLKLIPYESMVGIILALGTMLCFMIAG
jgi:GntP family gluconate:H+ symporter